MSFKEVKEHISALRADIWHSKDFSEGDYYPPGQERMINRNFFRKQEGFYMTTPFFDFTEFKDTTGPYNDPAEWIADSTAKYINMILLALPPEFRLEIRSERDRELVVKQVLEGLIDWIELINEGKMTHEHQEYVTTFYDWMKQAILDFIYSGALVTSRWTTEEIKEARVRAMKLLAGDV